MNTTTVRLLRTGVWGLPVFAGLLALSTVTHQPSYSDDFARYAGYVTTPVFLAGHLGASILGAAIGILGLVSLTVLAAERGPRPGRTVLGGALSVVGNVVNTSIYGVAAFAQPAIGRAYEAGADGVVPLNGDVYGPALFATAGFALLTWTAGAVLLGAGLRGGGLRVPGTVFTAALVVFYAVGIAVPLVQPVSGAVAAVAAVVLARRLAEVPAAVPVTVR